MTNELDLQRITIARALSQVTTLIRDDPEIISIAEKSGIKSILKTLIKIEEQDNSFYATSGGTSDAISN